MLDAVTTYDNQQVVYLRVEVFEEFREQIANAQHPVPRGATETRPEHQQDDRDGQDGEKLHPDIESQVTRALRFRISPVEN